MTHPSVLRLDDTHSMAKSTTSVAGDIPGTRPELPELFDTDEWIRRTVPPWYHIKRPTGRSEAMTGVDAALQEHKSRAEIYERLRKENEELRDQLFGKRETLRTPEELNAALDANTKQAHQAFEDVIESSQAVGDALSRYRGKQHDTDSITENPIRRRPPGSNKDSDVTEPHPGHGPPQIIQSINITSPSSVQPASPGPNAPSPPPSANRNGRQRRGLQIHR